MNRQEIFTKVATHLLTQNRKAEKFDEYYGQNVCVYRAPDGARCAAGCLIPDELYSPDFESKAINARDVLDVIGKSLGLSLSSDDLTCSGRTYATPDTSFLRKLQSIHDNEGVENWQTRLAHMARDFGLIMPIVPAVVARIETVKVPVPA